MHKSRLATTILVLVLASTAWAIPQPPADLASPAHTAYAPCGVRIQFYDFVPEDPDWWHAVALYVGNEQKWFALVVWPYPRSDKLDLWVDLDRDGKPDRYESWTNEEFESTYTWSACEFAKRLKVLQ
jgi:hypothetical protein